MTDNQIIEQLAAQVDELLGRYNDTRRELARLRDKEVRWDEERQRLVEKNHIAKNKVEAMITRLKNLEIE